MVISILQKMYKKQFTVFQYYQKRQQKIHHTLQHGGVKGVVIQTYTTKRLWRITLRKEVYYEQKLYLLYDPCQNHTEKGFVNQRGRAGLEPTSRL